jgi:hypothetical protein
MRCTRFTKPIRMIAGLLTGLLLASSAIPIAAQPANEIPAQHPSILVYDKAHEITTEATIQEVISRHVPGTPAGMHLVVTTSQGTFDAAMGPFLTKETQQALHAGATLQITGARQQFSGKQYLVVRQIVVDGRTVMVRTEHGIPLRSMRSASRTEKASHSELDGGAR